MDTLDIIIVNWNAGQQLADCLISIVRAQNDDFKINRVIIVDNASSDGSIDGLEKIGLPLTIIRNRENRGFAVACNQGARGSKADYILFLNPDTKVFADSLNKPIAFMDDPSNMDVGIVGIQLIDDSGQVSHSYERFPSPVKIWLKMLGFGHLLPTIIKSYFITDWNHITTTEVDYVIGAFFLVRPSVFVNLSGFDERFFVYWEDVDFAWRAKRAGYKCYYLADVQAYHKGGGTTEQVKVARLYYSLCSRILYSYKHFNKLAATGILLGTLLIEPLNRTTLGLARFSGKEIAETWKAYEMLGQDMPNMYRSIRG